MSKTALLVAPLLCLSVSACGFERGEDGRLYPAPDTPLGQVVEQTFPSNEWTERFVGTWLVDQPYHAGYEASFYTFKDDGTLIHEGDTGYTPFDTVGQVVAQAEPCEEWGCTNYEALVKCTFGTTWAAPSLDRLEIEGVCDDGESRLITLLFLAPASANASGWGQENVDATLEGFAPTHSGHGGFQWRYKKCFDANGDALDDTVGPTWDCEQFADLEED